MVSFVAAAPRGYARLHSLTGTSSCKYPVSHYNFGMSLSTETSFALVLTAFTGFAALPVLAQPQTGGTVAVAPIVGADLSADERQRLRHELREAHAERRLLRQASSSADVSAIAPRHGGVTDGSAAMMPMRASVPWGGPHGMSPEHSAPRLSESERQQLREQLRGYNGRSAPLVAPTGTRQQP